MSKQSAASVVSAHKHNTRTQACLQQAVPSLEVETFLV